MSDLKPEGVTVTIKGDGRDAPWTVFHGSVDYVCQAMIVTYALEGMENESLHNITNAANALVKLGGTVVRPGETESLGTSAKDGNVIDASQRFANKGEVDPIEQAYKRLSPEIDQAADIESLKEVWARNKDEFSANPKLMEEYTAKGISLRQASK